MLPVSVELWWATLPDDPASVETLATALPGDERGRADRFRVAGARARFVVGRSILRHVLGRALGADPSSLVIEVDARGRPGLGFVGVSKGLDFNLSHSAETVVVAVATGAVGVDVESVREIALADRLARRFFSASERDAVLGAAPRDRDRVFLRIWTQKEAWLKATGLGIGMPLSEVATEPDPTRPPRLVSIQGSTETVRAWAMIEVDIPGAVCTVAVRDSSPELAVRRIDPMTLGSD